MVVPNYLDTPSENDLIQMVNNAPALYKCFGGNTVYQLPQSVAVKAGVGITVQDFGNLKFAHESLRPTDGRVPEPYLYFEQNGVGYLFMEFLPGKTLDDLVRENPACKTFMMQKFRNVIDAMHLVERDRPGPIKGIKFRGFPWGDDSVTITSSQDFERQLNRRLIGSAEQFSLEG